MQIDVISKYVLVRLGGDNGDIWKFNLVPNTDMTRRMTIGTFALGKDEAFHLYGVLRQYFENGDVPAEVDVKDMRDMNRKAVPPEFRMPLKPSEPPQSFDFESEAARLQAENLKTDLPMPNPKKSAIVDLTMEEKSQM